MLRQSRFATAKRMRRAMTDKSMRIKTIIEGLLPTATGIFRRSADWITLSSSQKLLPPSAPMPALRSPHEQWARVTGVLADAQSRAHRALESHTGASAQLDAATYALQRLREEMAPAFLFTIPRLSPPPFSSTAFRREHFRRHEPLAA